MKVWRRTTLRCTHFALLSGCMLLASGCAANSPFSFMNPRGAATKGESLSASMDPNVPPHSAPHSPQQESAAARSPQSINPTQRLRVSPATTPVGPTEATMASASMQRVSPAMERAPALRTLGKQETLDQILQSAPGVVMVDFYADWCGPCKKQAQVLHQLEGTAAQHGATIVKVNVEEHPQLQQQFRITSLPTLLVMKDGKLVQRKKGLTQADQLAQWLAQ